MSQSLMHVDASEAVRSKCWRPSGRKESAVTETSVRRLTVSVLPREDVLVKLPAYVGVECSACAEDRVRTTLAYGASEPQAECEDIWPPLQRRSQICTTPSRLEVATIFSSPGWKRTCLTDDLCLASTLKVC